MRTLIAILLFLAGCGAVIYSYIGSMIMMAGDAGRMAESGDGPGAFFKILDFMLAGEIPQMTNFLYGGAFMIAVSVFVFIFRGKPKDKND